VICLVRVWGAMFSAAVRNIGHLVQGFLTSSLNWEEFLEALNQPELLGDFVAQHERTLGLHLLFLSQALKVPPADVAARQAAENFDRATFGIGQVLSHQPAVASRLPCALTLVESLARAVRHGWSVHHGVAKFAANSLVVLATCREAQEAARLAALEGLFTGLWAWLQMSPSDVSDGSEICGCAACPLCRVPWPTEFTGCFPRAILTLCRCSCSRPDTSAACWVERLLTKPDPLIAAWLVAHTDLEPWLIDLVKAVREQHGNPFCITHLLQIDGVAALLMASETRVDAGPRLEPEPEQVVPQAKPELELKSDILAEAGPMDRMRVAEDVMSCLTYSILTIDDSYFGEQAALALQQLARADEPHGVNRLLNSPTSIPMLEGLATTSCFHQAAVQLLRLFCEDRRGSICLRSLIGALSAADHSADGDGPATRDSDTGLVKAGDETVLEEGRVVDVLAANGNLTELPLSEDSIEHSSMGHGSGAQSELGRADNAGAGEEDFPTWQRFRNRVHVSLHGATAASLGDAIAATTEGGEDATRWPHTVEPDLAKAFSLHEIATEIASDVSPYVVEEGRRELVVKMSAADKRTWLNHRLFRFHHGSNAHDGSHDQEHEEPLAFIECDRDGCPLSELRLQREASTGIWDNISGMVEVRFKGESSVGSALLREWMAHVVDAGFLKASSNIVVSGDGGRTFLLSPSCVKTHPDTHELHAELLGRFIGCALLHRVCIGLRLHTHVCKLILAGGCPWEADDDEIREFDETLLRNHVQYLRRSSTPVGQAYCNAEELDELELTFTDPLDSFADGTNERVSTAIAQEAVELEPGGHDRRVTAENVDSYVRAVCEWRLFRSVEAPIAALLRGLRSVVPDTVLSSLHSMVTPMELQLLVAGLPFIDPQDWQEHTSYAGGFTEESPVVVWFWEAVHDGTWSSHELELILQFTTGSRQVPAGGFKELEGFNGGKHLFTLNLVESRTDDSLPTAHACICTLDLAPYTSKRQLVKRVRVAVTFAAVGFEERGDDEA
jgi:hypothetical protein